MKKKKTKDSLGQWLKKAIHFVEHDIWQVPLANLSPRRSFLIRQLRIFSLAIRGFNEDKVQLRASALTYYSLFSIIPIAGLAFGIAKGFGLETFLEHQMRMTFSGREEIYDWIMSFTQSLLQTTSGGMVAGIGLIILLYTIMMVLGNIEESFNDIWQVKKSRSLSRKFSDYFAIMFVAPVFFILSSAATVFLDSKLVSVSDSVALINYLSPVLRFLVGMIPYFLIWVMFLIVYLVMPNTSVKFKSALIGAIIAGTMFQMVQWAYLFFQIGVSRYNAIYGSFAALPLLMMWLQLSWLVVLFGAEIAYANQNVENYEFEAESQRISFFNKKLLSLYVMHLIVHNFMQGEKPMISAQIAHILQIPHKLVRSILNDLTDVGLLSETKTDHPKELGFQPSIDIGKVSVTMVMERLDKRGLDLLVAKPTDELIRLQAIIAEFSNQNQASGKNLLLKDLPLTRD